MVRRIKGNLAYASVIPGDTVIKNLSANAGNAREEGLIPGSGRSLGAGNGNPLQYSCLGNPLDREAWRATYNPWDHKQSDMTEQLKVSAHTHTHTHTHTAYASAICGSADPLPET